MSSISVVIPCYNYGHFLHEAVHSVLVDQPGVDVRVLIIDDASTDGSADVANEISRTDPRIAVVEHPRNMGNIATFNEGLIEWADGDYCLMLSADDRVTPGALPRAVNLLDAHPNVGFVYGSAVWFQDGEDTPRPRIRVRGWSIWPGQTWLRHRYRQAENPITCPTVVVRTSLQHLVGGYDPSMPHAADMEMFMRLAAHADVGFVRGADQAFYRCHGSSMSKAVSPLADLRNRREVLDQVLSRYGGAWDEHDRWSDAARHQLARESLWAAGRARALGGRSKGSSLARRLIGAGSAQEFDEAAELLSFASDCWPEVKRMPLYCRLHSSEHLGIHELLFMLDAKGRWWLRRRRWKYFGS